MNVLGFPRNLLAWIGILPLTVNCRNKGIGTWLLKQVIAEAAARGIIEVWGSIVRHDLDDSPFLLNWYTRNGFMITAPDSACIPSAVWKASLLLAGGPKSTLESSEKRACPLPSSSPSFPMHTGG